MINGALLELANKYKVNGCENGDVNKPPSTVDMLYLARAVIGHEERVAEMAREMKYTERALRERTDSAAVGVMLAILAHTGPNLPPDVVAEQAYQYADALARVSKKWAELAEKEKEKGESKP